MSRQANLASRSACRSSPCVTRPRRRNGHRPGSAYIECVDLSSLGPSTTWLWQRLARVDTARPAAVIDMADLAARLGLGPNLDPSRAMSRTVNRPRSSVARLRLLSGWHVAPGAR